MELKSRFSKLKLAGLDSPFLVLIPCFFVFCIFAFLGYCSFPVSDDFIMAQDTRKGFFWAIQYWLGFWFAGWFILALELSIPLVFDFWDYGLFFFIFIYLWLFSACFFLIKSFARRNNISLICSVVFVTFYILYNASPAETIYWNISALAYTGSLCLMMHCMAVFILVDRNFNTKKIKKDIYIISCFLFTLILYFIIEVKNFKSLINILDTIFNYDFLYFFWILLVLFILALIHISKRYYYSSFLLMFIIIFFASGFMPHINYFLLTFFAIYFIYNYSKSNKISFLSIFSLFLVVLFTIIMLLMPGIRNRVGLTNPNAVKDFQFVLNGIIYMFQNQFIYNYNFLSYLFIFVFSSFCSYRFFGIQLALKSSSKIFFIVFINIFIFSIVYYYGTNGHFPSRLISNFVAIYLLLFLFWGIFQPIKIDLPFQQVFVILICCIVFLISPNLNSALDDILKRNALGFRQYKLSQYSDIKNCKSDTCEVEYKNFKLQNIPDQEFIFPNESGFVLSHKLFISRYFGKEFIRYNPETLPPELRK